MNGVRIFESDVMVDHICPARHFHNELCWEALKNFLPLSIFQLLEAQRTVALMTRKVICYFLRCRVWLCGTSIPLLQHVDVEDLQGLGPGCDLDLISHRAHSLLYLIGALTLGQQFMLTRW